MNVVRPEWLVESAAAGALLPWTNYIFRPGGRVDTSQGSQVGQRTLMPVSKPIPIPSNGNPGIGQEQAAQSEEDNTAGSSLSGLQNTDHSARSPPRPLYTTDPATYEDAVRVPGYAFGESNQLAERVMADPQWRAAHTSIAPDFIEGFYKNSRLHHLSMWKAELKNLVAEAQERAESGKFDRAQAETFLASRGRADVRTAPTENISMRGAELVVRSPSKNKGKQRAEEQEKVIMHCDFDCFFVSGNQGGASSTSEIASSSYEARSFGIKNGMSLRQGRQLCPSLITIPYEFERYKALSLQFYTILMRYADDLQAVSVDEALIDVSYEIANRKASAPLAENDHALALAETIRAEVKAATGCEVSIGVAENIQLARIATRKAKPAGAFHLERNDVHRILEPLDIDDLHGFGHSTREKAKEKLGTAKVRELMKKSKGQLCEALGKGTGETLYKALRGIDDRKIESDKPRKSVSCDINYGVRFEDNDQAETFIYRMAEEVARRLDDISMRGRSLTLKIMKRDPSAPREAPKFMGHGICETFNRQTALANAQGQATSDAKDIGDHAWRLLKSFEFDPKELRGVGIQIQKLEKTDAVEIAAQARLPFQPRTHPKSPERKADVVDDMSERPEVIVYPPSQGAGIAPVGRSEAGTSLDVPPFSQIDVEIFNALPEDIRRELEEEYKQRSKSPMPKDPLPALPESRMLVKATNVKHITQQLAPKTRGSISLKKNTLFSNRVGPSSVRVTDEELRNLDIDPEVFAMLPIDVQREQLTTARHLKNGGVLTKPTVIKDIKRKTRVYPRKPPPQAKHPQHPTLKQQGPQKGEKLLFTQTDDVQRVIEAWVEGFREHPPNQKDVEYFSKFLVQNVESSDTGMEKTVAVMKWWLVLLRKHWEIYEHADPPEPGAGTARVTSEAIGRAWWIAFQEVKSRVDAAARKRFGGSLCLR
ncbi:hypothetical protein ID866_5566 [Astraeus odoratus]|nr:hypothetical protein ID866_5566 [Astraeus odoratus]